MNPLQVQATTMKNSAKLMLRKIPGVSALIRTLSYYKTTRYIHKNRFSTPEELFTDYYKKKFWGTDESASGHGSTVKYTEKLRKGIEELIATHQFKSLLDAPCGDFNWFQHVRRAPEVHYLGGDIVKELINSNNQNFGSPNTRFIQLDIINERIPDADIWICRDVLFHFSYKDIQKTLQNFLNSDIPYLLTTSHTHHDTNKDIITGNYRFLNLERAPFNFCSPITRIDDWIEGYPVRHMCLWHKEDIRKQIMSMQV